MTKKFILLAAVLLFFACKEDGENAASTAPTNQEALVKEPTSKSTKEENLANLKARAIDEGDTFGRVNNSLGSITKQFVMSNRMKPQDGKRSIFVDEKFTIIVRHENGEDVTDLKVNLKNLNQQNGGMRLIPEKELDDLPGFAISVIDGKPGVEVIKNGEKIGEERELKIFMADRSLIEQAVPAFLQALNVVHGRT
ncbi:MAG: hypothetical protein AAFZ15_30385 [Bacteroidota bacterium]